MIDVSELSIEEIALRIVRTVERSLAPGARREAEASGPALALGALVGRCSASRSFVFYGLFTPFWFALRSLAWLAEFRARRRR